MADTRDYDVVVIGAGLGGLLSAAQFLRRGQRVAIVERLAHPGGRFTAKTFHGAQVSTGAVHMLPFGTNGLSLSNNVFINSAPNATGIYDPKCEPVHLTNNTFQGVATPVNPSGCAVYK